MYRLLRQISHKSPNLEEVIKILGGAQLWQNAIEGAQAVHASSRTFSAWKQGLVHWATAVEPKKAPTLPSLIVSVELGALSVAYLSSWTFHVLSGSAHGIPARSNLAAPDPLEISQGNSGVVTLGTHARQSRNGYSSYQENTAITPTAAGLVRRTGYKASSKSPSKTMYSSTLPRHKEFFWTWILLELLGILIDSGDIISHNFMRIGVLAELLILIIDGLSNGRWRSSMLVTV